MKCEKCGAELFNSAKFCPNCGSDIKVKARTLECSKCGGLMTVDSDNSVMICPYCGNKELIKESDNVIKQRIRSKTMINVSKNLKELGTEYIETKERQKQEKQKHDIKILIGMVTIVMIIIIFCCIMSMIQ